MAEIRLTKENYEETVTRSDKPVLIDFSAEWCGPCRLIAPAVEEISETMADKLKVCTVDVDAEPGLAERFGITLIPTLAVVAGGETKAVSTGYKTKEQILAWLSGNV